MTTKTAQFTPGPWVAKHSGTGDATVVAECRWANKDGTPFHPTIVPRIDWATGNLIAAAPAMYEALSDAEGMWNIARLIDSKHHAENPISNDLWSDFHQYLMEWYGKRKAALAQAEGK